MVVVARTPDRRSLRREATKLEILDAAWDLARTHGLAAVSLRAVADRVGMRSPSLYNYFESKNAIYDAMFAQGAQQFLDVHSFDGMTGDALHDLRLMVHQFVEFCVQDAARYQLLFQRTIPGFEPSAESFAISEQGLALVVAHLEHCGISGQRHLDLFTALGTGLADQQISNDPGGTRWISLIDEAVEMFVNHTTESRATRPSDRRKRAG
jgi:AcrR family transcriptional regulator